MSDSFDSSGSQQYSVYIQPPTTRQLRSSTVPSQSSSKPPVSVDDNMQVESVIKPVKKLNSHRRRFPSKKPDLRAATSYVNILNPLIRPSKFTKSGSLRFDESSTEPTDLKRVSMESYQQTTRPEGDLPIVTVYTSPVLGRVKDVKKDIKKGGTTFSDILKESGPIKTVVTRARPSYKSAVIQTGPENEGLAIYGKNINVTKAVLQKEIQNFAPLKNFKNNKQKSAKLNSIQKRRAFKTEDLSTLPKRYMKVSFSLPTHLAHSVNIISIYLLSEYNCI